MHIQYVGPSVEGVIVPDLERVVGHNEIIELTTDEEIEVGKRLLEQEDIWRAAKKGKTPSAPESDDAG